MDNEIEVNLVGEDSRHPILVVSNEFSVAGYDLDPDTLELTRTCICAARSEYECCCGYDYSLEEL